MTSFAHDSRTWTEAKMREWLAAQTGPHIREIAASLGLPTTRRPGRMPLAALIDSIVAERMNARAVPDFSGVAAIADKLADRIMARRQNRAAHDMTRGILL